MASSPAAQAPAPARATPAAPACPVCGKAMEKGLLAAESFVGGAKWVKERTRLALGGESLAPPDRWGNVYLDGFRCTGCRILALSY